MRLCDRETVSHKRPGAFCQKAAWAGEAHGLQGVTYLPYCKRCKTKNAKLWSGQKKKALRTADVLVTCSTVCAFLDSSQKKVSSFTNLSVTFSPTHNRAALRILWRKIRCSYLCVLSLRSQANTQMVYSAS